MNWFEDYIKAIGTNEFVRDLLPHYIHSTHNNLTYQQLTMRENEEHYQEFKYGVSYQAWFCQDIIKDQEDSSCCETPEKKVHLQPVIPCSKT